MSNKNIDKMLKKTKKTNFNTQKIKEINFEDKINDVEFTPEDTLNLELKKYKEKKAKVRELRNEKLGKEQTAQDVIIKSPSKVANNNEQSKKNNKSSSVSKTTKTKKEEKVVSPQNVNVEDLENQSSGKEDVIVFNGVNLKIDNDKILRDINLSIKKGEFVYFVGTSGAGKSSMIKLIYRERKHTGGDLMVLDFNLSKIREKSIPRLRRKVGVIFQDYKLLPEKTIYENVKFTLDVTGFKSNQKREIVEETLKKVGIFDQRNKFPDELSGGQQQRAAIARAIVDNPELLVCDEPTGNLDPENAIAIMNLLHKVNQQGTTVLMATHDVGIVNKYKNRVVLMDSGRIVEETQGKYIYK